MLWPKGLWDIIAARNRHAHAVRFQKTPKDKQLLHTCFAKGCVSLAAARVGACFRNLFFQHWMKACNCV